MATFFISHSSEDRTAAERVRATLVADGFGSVFLDFHADAGIPPGRRWEEELYSELRRADVVVFLASRAAVRSKWCHAELTIARALGRTVVPVVLEPGARHPLLNDVQEIVLPAAGDGLASALRRISGDAADRPAWDGRVPPFPGLLPLGEDLAGVFFGRDEEVSSIVDGVTWPPAEGPERFTLVVGSSGCGKSSLLRAGVIPQLRRRDHGWTVLPVIVPREDPVVDLAGALANGERTRENCRRRLELGSAGLGELIDDLPASPGVLIAIDQAEQLVTQCARAARIEFVDLLAGALAQRGALRVVLTLRSEYLSALLEGTQLEGHAAPVVPIGRLDDARLPEVIQRPAERSGLVVEPGLVARMVHDTRIGTASGGDALPLLAFTLRQLYDDPRRHRGHMTIADYEAVGGVVGALRREADRVHAALERAGRGAEVVPTLLRLVHVEGEREAGSRGVSRSRFDAAAADVVRAFTDARLLTTGGDPPVVFLAHEAMLREWPLLSRAIEQSHDELVTRSRVDRDAREWAAAARDPSYLISGRRLADAERIVRAEGQELDSVVRDFIRASRRRATRQALRSRSLYVLIAGIVLAAAVTLTASMVDRARAASRREAARGPTFRIPGTAVALDRHEVTYRQYALCWLEGSCIGLPVGDADNVNEAPETKPVTDVDAQPAAEFCRWIGRRLPTPGELERAARSGELEHLIREGQEWTNTKVGEAGQDGIQWLQDEGPMTVTISSNHRSADLGFRCAEPASR